MTDRVSRLDHLLPPDFRPMRAVGPATDPRPSDCLYEPDWAGLRVLAAVEGTEWLLRSDRGEEVTAWFPELEDLRRAVQPYAAVFDGEIVVEVGERPHREALQQWIKLKGAPRLIAPAGGGGRPQAALYLTDVLRIGESWLLDVPWEDRRRILEQAVVIRPQIRLSPIASRPGDLVAFAASQGLERLVARGRRSRYLPGRRSREWQRLRLADARHLDATIAVSRTASP